MTTPPRTLGDLQLAILQVLWARRHATVSEVHAALLEERGLALTTIATMLAKLEQKGVVKHRSAGRRYVYRPLVTEAEVRRSLVGELTTRLFDGDTTALVSHLIAEHATDPDELRQLKRLIAERESAEPEIAERKSVNPSDQRQDALARSASRRSRKRR